MHGKSLQLKNGKSMLRSNHDEWHKIISVFNTVERLN